MSNFYEFIDFSTVRDLLEAITKEGANCPAEQMMALATRNLKYK